jgi:hypothetical protein
VLNKIPNNFITYSILVILGILIVFWDFLDAPEKVFHYSGLGLIHLKNFENQVFNKALFILIGMLSFSIFSKINNKYKFVEGVELPILFFTIVGFSTIQFVEINLLTTVSFLFLLLSLRVILKVHNQKSIKGILFSTGFLLGIGCLFYAPIIFGALPILLTIAIFRPFKLKNYLLLIVGLAIPFIYFLSFSYLLEIPIKLSFISSEDLVPQNIFIIQNIPLTLYIIIGLLSILFLSSARSKYIVRQRNQLLILASYLALLVLYSFVLSMGQLVFFSFPILAWCIAFMYKKIKKKWILELIACGLIIFSIWVKL